MIKFSTSSTAWQQIWQVLKTKAENKQNNTFFFFSIKEVGKNQFEMTEKFSFNFSGTDSWITFG